MAEYVDLGPVIRTIQNVGETLNRNIAVVDGKVQVLSAQAEATRDRLQALYEEFTTFVESDRKAKEVQKAITEIVRVRQEIEKKFGHYDEVRRITIGILQATDAGLVRQNTIHGVTEELMLAAPGYWLAPTLVALSSWIKDDRTLAEKALRTAMARDDYKASLFFALVCRRARRQDATTRWLTRYFQMQDPMSMDRELVVMLDALANGVFGGSALVSCSTVIEQWLTELEQQAGFVDEQRQRWTAKLDVMAPVSSPAEYPTMHKNSPTAPALDRSLSAARRNQVVLEFFSNLYEGEIVVPPRLEQAVDDILASLVKNFDDEELPLRKEERLYQLIKDENGDAARAKSMLAAEYEVFEEKTNFAALLTNSAMNPEQFGATRATQRYAVSRCRQWILAAHKDIVARDRSSIPDKVDLTCGSWKGQSADGSNEEALSQELTRHYNTNIQQAVDAVKLSPGVWIAVVAGGLIGLLSLGESPPFGIIVLGAAGAFFFWKFKDLDRIREETRQKMIKERDQARAVLKACLAELADYRREVAAEDAKSAKVVEFLESLTAPQFVLQRPEQTRVTVA